MYYKLGQACVTNSGSFVLLQIRVNVVTNWDSFITTNWGSYYKLGNRYYKIGELLQIGAGITNLGNYCKLGHNKCHLLLLFIPTSLLNSFWCFLSNLHLLSKTLAYSGPKSRSLWKISYILEFVFNYCSSFVNPLLQLKHLNLYSNLQTGTFLLINLKLFFA